VEDNHLVRLSYENDIFRLAVWIVETHKRSSIFVIEEFLYVQSTVEQIIPILVALGCIKALGVWRRKKHKGAVTNIEYLTVLIEKTLG
jgi:hypothetical protein